MRRHSALFLSLMVACSAGAEPASPRILARYKEMLAANPVEGTALDRLWKEYATTGQTAELMAEYEGAAGFAAKMVLGHLLQRAERAPDAEAAFVAAGRLEPGSPLPLLALGKLRMAGGRATEAANALERAVEVLGTGDPRLGAVLQELGSARLAAGDAAGAAEAWEKIVALDPRNLELRRQLAEQYAKNRLPEPAKAHLLYLTAHAPAAERARAWQELASLYQQGDQAEEALRALEQGIALTARGNWLRNEMEGQLIRLYQRLGRVPELEERWKKEARENPRDAGGELQLADLYHRLGRPEEERQALERLSALLPKNTEYRARLARLLVRLDDVPGAAARYDELLAAPAANADWVFERADLDIRAGRPEAAEARLGALLKTGKDDESIRARVLEFYGQHRLWKPLEAMLAAGARDGGAEGIQAYASFLFTQHRDAEATEQLRRQRAGGTPASRAAAALRIGAVLRQQSLLPAAAEEVRLAAELAAEPARRREALLTLGEIETTLDHPAAAREAVEAAARLSVTPAEIAESDQRLYDVLRQVPGKGEAEPGAEPLVLEREAALAAAATRAGTAEAWLRVARWQAWGRKSAPAQQSIEHALALDPRSLEAHELAIKLAATEPGEPGAAAHLQRLVELDPAHAAGYRRRIAEVALQNGHAGAAIRGLEALARERPADLELLAALAAAQQTAERWTDALETWRRIYDQSPASRRKECLTPLLRIYARLSQPRPAAELLLAETNRDRGGKEERELFPELLEHCRKRDLLPWLREQWEERRRAAPEDFFTEVAYSEILKAVGDRAGAFRVLMAAQYAAPEPADALPELVHEAEELRQFTTAIELQEKLVRLAPQEHSENLAHLAELQEKDFQEAAAGGTWTALVRRFPRDAEALQRAAEFHCRQGEILPAAALLHRVLDLDGPSVPVLQRLAQCQLESGDEAAAEASLEQVLQLAPLPPAEETIRFPELTSDNPTAARGAYLALQRQHHRPADPRTLEALRGIWIKAGGEPAEERDQRLNAIRELAWLTRAKDDPAALERWVSRWRQTATAHPSEALWAMAHAGAGAAAFELATRFCGSGPAQWANQESLIGMALELREFSRLGDWLGEAGRPTETRDLLRRVLGKYAAEHGTEFEPALLEGLALAGRHGRRWDIATLCSQIGSPRAALLLSEKPATNDRRLRGAHLLQRGEWQLATGDLAAAQQSLTEAAARLGESYSAPAFAALRESWLTLPPPQRALLRERVGAGDSAPLGSALAGLLLSALSGDRSGTQAEVNRLLALRPILSAPVEELQDESATRLNAGARYWAFVLGTGVHLLEWRLPAAAAALWRTALADPALLRLQGPQAEEMATEVRARLFAIRLALAEPAEIDSLLEEYTHGPQQIEGITAVAEALEGMGALPQALQVYRRLWGRDPGNPQLLRGVLNLCAQLDDSETTETVLKRCIDERLYSANDNVQRDLIFQLLDAQERRQDFTSGQAALNAALDTAPFDTRLLQRQAQALGHAGRPAEAEEYWRRLLSIEPGHANARHELAMLLQTQDDFTGAVALLEKSVPEASQTAYPRLLYLAGRTGDALAALERLPPAGQVTAATMLSKSMRERGETKPAHGVLQAAVARSTQPARALELQQRLLEALATGHDAAASAREVRRFRRLAGNDPARLGVYYSHVYLHAAELGVEAQFRTELQTAWADGAGIVQAGMVLLSAQLEHSGPDAERTLSLLLSRPEMNGEFLRALVSPLRTARRADLAARAQERLSARFPAIGHPLEWIATLQEAGQHGEALTAMERWVPQASLSPDLAARAAQAWLDLGEPKRAEPLFAQATARGLMLPKADPYLAYARLLVAQGRVREAAPVLRQACRYPASHPGAELAAWLKAGGELERVEEALRPFSLTAGQEAEVRQALQGETE